jgi:uncharacterized membrane protein (DUF485 family)
MNSDGCSAEPCPSEEELRELRVMVVVIVTVIFLIAYFTLAWRPVLPEWDWILGRALQGISACLSQFVCFGDAQGDVGGGVLEVVRLFKWLLSKAGAFLRWWREQGVSQYLKIFITYLQVLGSFTALTVEWPDLVLQAFASLKNFAQMNPLTIKGVSCLFIGTDFFVQLYAYILGLIGFTIALALPVCGAFLRGYRQVAEHKFR